MTSSSTSTDTTTLEGLDFDVQCGVKNHGSNSDYHDDGKAEWFMSATCPSCGEYIEHFVCDRFAKTDSEGMWHNECGSYATSEEWNFKAVKL